MEWEVNRSHLELFRSRAARLRREQGPLRPLKIPTTRTELQPRGLYPYLAPEIPGSKPFHAVASITSNDSHSKILDMPFYT